MGTKGRAKRLVRYIGPSSGTSRQQALERLINQVERLERCDDYPPEESVTSDEDSDDDEDDGYSPPPFYTGSGGVGGFGRGSSDAPSNGGRDRGIKRKSATDSKDDGRHDKKHKSEEPHRGAQCTQTIETVQHRGKHTARKLKITNFTSQTSRTADIKASTLKPTRKGGHKQ